VKTPKSPARTTLSSKRQSHHEVSELTPGRRKARVLVVDDSPDTMAVMRELLSTRGYDVVVTANAANAESQIRQEAPDLILCDVIMPGKSGYEFCKELKANPSTRLIPFVLTTGLSDREARLRGIESGADDFLSKPIAPEELFARVTSLLKLKEFTDELENAESVLCTLGLIVEGRDPYTVGHCERLAEDASALGRHLGLDGDAVVALRRGGYLHDLGKIAVPDEILKKGSDLTLSEWQVMKQHPATGESICRPLKSFRLILPIIRSHHEHWNGSGYPDGLRGEEIPLLARILQVVDVYDALRTERPYKPVLGHEKAALMMRREADAGLWDKHLVEEYLSLLRKRRHAA